MIVKAAQEQHLTEIMRVLVKAQQFMVQSGNPNQWAVGYPTVETVRQDILNRVGYVVLDDDTVCGYFALILGKDPTYGYIEGDWLSDSPYGTIHRIASDQSRKGVFSAAMTYCLSCCKHLRIDTHANNAVMQKLILRHGFTYCGIIYVADGSPRLAYERIHAGNV